MRIAITDFDGTLKRNGVVSDEDIAAIIKWRENGNRFGIATGRDLGMTLHETAPRGIFYDFLICVNGGGIYDRDNSLLQGRLLDDDLVTAILSHPAALASMHYTLSDDGVLQLFLRGGESWFPGLGIPYKEVSFDEALAIRGLRQISFAYTGVEECTLWTKALMDDLGTRVTAHQNTNCIDITPRGVDKAQGVADLLSLKEWTDCETLVIGDGRNDKEMIHRYDGYTVPNASVRIKKIARKTVASVAEMLAFA